MSSTPPPPPPPPPPGRDPGSPEGSGEPGASAGPDSPSHPSHDAVPAAGGPGTGFPSGPGGAQRNSAALAALILGLIAFPGAFVIGLVPFVQVVVLLTPLVAIAAIVLGVLGIRRAKRPAVSGGVGMGVTGIVLGGINLLLTAGLIVMAVTFLRACPIDVQAPPEQATEQMLECMADQGWLGPMEADDLEDELDGELDDL